MKHEHRQYHSLKNWGEYNKQPFLLKPEYGQVVYLVKELSQLMKEKQELPDPLTGAVRKAVLKNLLGDICLNEPFAASALLWMLECKDYYVDYEADVLSPTYTRYTISRKGKAHFRDCVDEAYHKLGKTGSTTDLSRQELWTAFGVE